MTRSEHSEDATQQALDGDCELGKAALHEAEVNNHIGKPVMVTHKNYEESVKLQECSGRVPVIHILCW